MQFYGFSKSTQVVKSIWSRYHRFLKAHCRAIHGMQGAFAVSGQITKRCQWIQFYCCRSISNKIAYRYASYAGCAGASN